MTFAAHARAELPELKVIIEPEPLGTGGGLRHAAQAVGSATFVALNGDSWMPQPLAPVLEAHAATRAQMTMVAVPASRVEGPARRKGLCRLAADDRLLGFETVDEATDGWVNGGLYILDRGLVERWPSGRYSLEAELMQLTSGSVAKIFRSSAALLDIGTLECLQRAEALWLAEAGEVRA